MEIRYSLHAKADHKRFMKRLLQIYRAHYIQTNSGKFSNWIGEKLRKHSAVMTVAFYRGLASTTIFIEGIKGNERRIVPVPHIR